MPRPDAAYKIVELDDGRKVKVSELTGLDEMIAAKVVGAEQGAMGGQMLTYQQVLIAFSITEIDGKPVQRAANLNQIRALMAQFKMRHTSRIALAFNELNVPQGEGEAQAAESGAATPES